MNHMYSMALIMPEALASMVFTAMEPIAQVAVARSTQGRAGVEPEPAERQDQAAGDDQHNIVASMTCGLPSRENLPISRAEDHGNG